MNPHRTLRLTSEQHQRLLKHLFPGDGCESVALALCGTRLSAQHEIFCVHEIAEIPHQACSLRNPTAVRWPVEQLIPILNKAAKRDQRVLKIHSHPTGFADFSEQDNESDTNLSRHLTGFVDASETHLSAFMLPNGNIVARSNHPRRRALPIQRIVVIGDDLVLADNNTHNLRLDEAEVRTRQAFGEGTVRLLKSLTVGVVGCSGTGSWVVEMLARLAVGGLILVDPDIIERKNLNRIINSTAESARQARPKVAVLRDAVAAMGFGTQVEILIKDLASADVVKALGTCDLLIGCVDSADGRDLLNRISSFYVIPYLDVGVRLDADGNGGISQACAAIHYLIPGGSSLLTRGVISAEQVAAQAMRRTNPNEYEARLREGYVKGVRVDSPAVISLNGFAASHTVNEMLARLHPYRPDGNAEYRYQLFSLRDGVWHKLPDAPQCKVLGKRVGRGDCIPLIDNPSIT